MRSTILELAAEGTIRGRLLEDVLWEWIKKITITMTMGNPTEPLTPEILEVYQKFYGILEGSVVIPWTDMTKDKLPTHMRKKGFSTKCQICPARISYYAALFSVINGVNKSPFIPRLELMQSPSSFLYSPNDRPLVGICENRHRIGAIRKYCRVNESISWCYYDIDSK